jgi:hypothetical protein
MTEQLDYLTTGQAAALLGISTARLRQIARAWGKTTPRWSIGYLWSPEDIVRLKNRPKP